MSTQFYTDRVQLSSGHLILVVACFLASCAEPGMVRETQMFSWHVPWNIGEQFRLIRVEHAFIKPTALGLEDERLIPQFGWKQKVEFHGRITVVDRETLSAELVVAKARVDAIWGSAATSTEYVKGQGQVDLDTGQSEEVDEDWSRVYHIKIDNHGVLVDWEGRLGALELLHGLGGEYYNVFTSLLLSIPEDPLDEGSRWEVLTGVRIALCDKVPIRLHCKLDGTREHNGEVGHVILADATLPVHEVYHLRKCDIEGSGTWWISSDLKTIQGKLTFHVLDEDGDPIIDWLDEIELRPLKNGQ